MYGLTLVLWIAIAVVASASDDNRPLLLQHAHMDEALAREGRRLLAMIDQAKVTMDDMLVQLKREETSVESFAKRQRLQQALLKLQVERENAELALASLRGPLPAGGRISRADLDRTMHTLDDAYRVAESLMVDRAESPTAGAPSQETTP
jgi:hypothetical protein